MITTKKEIKKWLNRHHINDFEILEDLSVNVFGSVNLTSIVDYEALPVSFRTVDGDFNISDNIKLKSLVGCPSYVKGDFNSYGTSICSLVGGPQIVEGDFFFTSDVLKSLEGSPKRVDGSFKIKGGDFVDLSQISQLKLGKSLYLLDNKNLQCIAAMPKVNKDSGVYITNCNLLSLKGLPSELFEISIINNPNLMSFEGISEKVNNSIHANNCNFKDLSYLSLYIGKDLFLNGNNLLSIESESSIGGLVFFDENKEIESVIGKYEDWGKAQAFYQRQRILNRVKPIVADIPKRKKPKL